MVGAGTVSTRTSRLPCQVSARTLRLPIGSSLSAVVERVPRPGRLTPVPVSGTGHRGPMSHDAVVIGAGPNGLVAANLLVDAGWDVVVLEASPQPGGAVRSADDFPAPGFTGDLFSAFYPLAAASPVLDRLDLDRYGLTWTHAPAVLAHVFDDGRAAVLSRDLDATAASVDAFAPGDGDAWRTWA